VGCGGRQLDPPADPVCTHPCDLAQTIRVDIVGSEPAAAVTVTEPCSGGVADCGAAGCRIVDLYLSSSIGSSGPPLVCHVTAVSRSGVVVERDVMATYNGDFCCAGYEVGSSLIDIDFSTSDAGISDGSSDAGGD